MGFKSLGESSSESGGGFRPLQPGTVSTPLPEDDHAALDLTNEEMDALPAQLSRDYGQGGGLVARAREIISGLAHAPSPKAAIEQRVMDVGKGAANFLDWPMRASAAVPLAIAEAIKTPGYNWARDFPESLSTFTESGHMPYTGPADIPVGGGEKIPIGAVPEHALGSLFQAGGEGIAKRTEQLREAGYLSPGAATAFETAGNALMFALGGRIAKRGGEARTGREVSTVVRPQEAPGAPAPNPVEEWLAKKAEQRAGPIQDVTEVGGVEPGKQIVPARPAPEARPLEYQGHPDLTPEERVIESRFGQQLRDNTDQAIADYKQRFGNVINTDNARELSQDYQQDRTQSLAVHEPSSAFVKEMYRRDLEEPAPPGKENDVVFTAGGSGAGKTSAVSKNEGLKAIVDHAQIVYDTNMNSYPSAKNKIDQALKAGKNVSIIYVHRDPLNALIGQEGMGGALSRATKQAAKEGTGRTVPLSEFTKTHVGARDVVQRIANEYGSNPKVSILSIDNKGPGRHELAPLTSFPRYRYNELHGRLQTALREEHSAGRISDEVYHAVARTVQGEGEAVRGDGAREPAGAFQAEPEAALVGVEGRAASLVKRDSKGRVIGGFGARHLNAVNATLRRMEALAREGEHGKGWYEESAKELLRVTEGDKNAADRIAQVLAITSAGTEIKANFTMASKALEQYAKGEPIHVATKQKDLALENLLRKGVVPESVKVDDFYRNLAQHISGEMTDRPVTDRWQFRIASGQKVDKGSAQQYEYTSMLAAETAKRLGWRPDEAQAAMWVAMKARARYEMMRTSARESENSKFKGLSKDELKRLALENAKTSFASEIQVRNWKPPEGIKFPPLEELRQVGLERTGMAKDMFDQLEFLDEKARDLGYPDAQALFDAKPRDFNRLAEEWRNRHELEQAGAAGHGIDQIAVSFDEPTGSIAKTLEAKFEPSVYLERYQRQLIPKEKPIIATAVRDVITAGMPEHVLEATGGFAATVSGGINKASFNVLNRTISVGEILDVEAPTLRGYLAHELTHAIDHEVTGDNPKLVENFISANSPRLGLGLKPGSAWLIEGTGDISKEIVSKWERGNNFRITEFFDYPLDRDVPEGLMKAELFAQSSRLYLTNPELMKKELPIAYSAMKEIYDHAGTSLAETRNAIRTTFQTPGAAARHPEAVGRGSELQGELFQAAQRGSGERSPGERVVGVEARPEHGGRPPDETKRSVVGVQGPNPHWDIDQPGLIDNAIRDYQDNKIDLKRVQEAIEKSSGAIPERSNAYLVEEAMRARASAAIKQFYKNGVEPVLKDIKQSGLTIDDVGKYLWARHAPEANKHLERINPGKADLSGMTDQEAAKTLASFSGAKRQALDRIAQQVDAITKGTRDFYVTHGLEDRGTIDAWESAYKHYVPLMRDLEADGATKTGQGFAIRGSESMRRVGSQKDVVTVLAAVIAQRQRAIIRAEKAEVGRALVRLFEDFPNPDFVRVDQPPMKRSINPQTGLVQNTIDPLWKQRDDVFIVKGRDANGDVVERALVFNKKNERAMRLAASMKNLDVVQLQGVTRLAGYLTRFWSNLATKWNPYFWETNPIRDVREAIINLQSTPLKGQAGAVLSRIPRAMAGIASAEFRNGTGRWAALYKEAEANGMKTAWVQHYESLKDLEADLLNMMNRSQRSEMNPLKWAGKAADLTEKMNDVMEGATRLAVYAQARKAGLSIRQSVSIAKNITVNFDKKGNRSSAIGAWYMFFNARVQGTARVFSALAKSKRARAYVGAMVAFNAALSALNWMVGDEDQDENGSNPYDLIPEYVRQRNTVFMIPKRLKEKAAEFRDVHEIKNSAGRVVGYYVTLPLPYGYSLFANAGRLGMDQALQSGGAKFMSGDTKASDRAWNLTQVALDTFLPFSSASTPLQYAAPTVVTPAVQYLENKTWYGAPMRPEPQTFGPATPNHKLYFRSTSDTAKDLTKWLSDTTGGDDVTGGGIDISPTTVMHGVNTMTGGTGKFVMDILDFSKHVAGRVTGERSPEDLPWRGVPFVGKVFAEVDDRERAAKFYSLRPKAMDVWKKMETYRKAGDYDKASQVEEENPALAAMARELVSKSFKKEMKGFREEFKTVVDLPRSERQRERDRLKAEEVSTMARAIEAYNTAARESR